MSAERHDYSVAFNFRFRVSTGTGKTEIRVLAQYKVIYSYDDKRDEDDTIEKKFWASEKLDSTGMDGLKSPILTFSDEIFC